MAHCLAKQCLSLYFAVGRWGLEGWGGAGGIIQPPTSETEEEVESPSTFCWALKVFLYVCADHSHHC